MASYYDFVLVLIPVSLLGVSGFLTGLGIDLSMAVPLGATVAVGLIGHAMFVRAPTDVPRTPAGPEPGFAPSAD